MSAEETRAVERRWERPKARPEVWMIIVKHALRDERGKVMRCYADPGEADLSYAERRERRRSDGKVIYSSGAAARAASEEMDALEYGSPIVYECLRSGQHFHLARGADGHPPA